MNKSDLKTGMMVVRRDGGRLLVMKDNSYGKNIFVRKSGFHEYDQYFNENLKHGQVESYDIIAVYKLNVPTGIYKFFEDKYNDFELIWSEDIGNVNEVLTKISELHAQLDVLENKVKGCK